MTTLIDLSHPIRPGMPIYPGDPETSFHRHADYDSDGCLVHSVALGTHAGTHLDAPAHWLRNGVTVDSPSILTACVGPAKAIDVTQTAEPGLIAPLDLKEAGSGISEGDRILLATGWSEQFGRPGYFEGYPSVSEELAEWFACRRIAMLGVETPSLHRTHGDALHTILLSAGIIIVENLANLKHIAGKTVFFSAAPLAFAGLDGSTVRAYALV